MEGVVRHVLMPLVKHPDSVAIKTVDGESVVMMELQVHEDDRAVFEEEDGKLLRAMRTLLSAAAGRRKAPRCPPRPSGRRSCGPCRGW